MNLSLLNVLSIVVLVGLIVMALLHYRLDRKRGKKNRP
jgi:Tfp pilus assembly protein PilX